MAGYGMCTNFLPSTARPARSKGAPRLCVAHPPLPWRPKKKAPASASRTGLVGPGTSCRRASVRVHCDGESASSPAPPSPAEEEEQAPAGSDLWSFVDQQSGERDAADGGERGGGSGSGDEGEDYAIEELMAQVPEELKREAEVARREKDELELIRLELESNAQDLAEGAVEVQDELKRVTEDLEAAREKLAEAREEEDAAVARVSRDEANLTELKEAMCSDRDYLDETGQLYQGGITTFEADVAVPETTEDTNAEDKAASLEVDLGQLEEQVEQERARRAELELQRAGLEAECAGAAARAESLSSELARADSAAAREMEQVELAVAAEMAAEARSKECDKKVDEAVKMLTKEMKKRDGGQSGLLAPQVEEGEVVGAGALADLTTDSRDAAEGDVAAMPPIIAEDAVEDALVELEEQIEELKDSVAQVNVSEVIAEPVDKAAAAPAPATSPEAEAEGSPVKAKPSSKFFSASYFTSLRKERLVLPPGTKRWAAVCLLAGSAWFAASRFGPRAGLRMPHPEHVISSGWGKVADAGGRMKAATQEIIKGAGGEQGVEGTSTDSALSDTLWLLATSVVVVPLIGKLPGGSPVLGFLLGGALIGPNALGIINNVDAVHHVAELGVIFLLFNIGLELSFERLQAMQKYVFGLGACQVMFTMLAIAGFASKFMGLDGAAAVITAAAMALSSTAVSLQVLQDRGEASSRHGRGTFSVLLFQDLAVVVFLMLLPLLEQSAGGGAISLQSFALSIGQAVAKAVVAIAVIIAGGRLVFRPLYKRIASASNAEIFAATTLLVVLGTSVLTQRAGLSMELGAFIAGLLLAETEYALQVESDIAPYRGLLLGLFFMTVGMEFSAQLLVSKWKTIAVAMVSLLAAKTAIVALFGPLFGLSRLASTRAGLMLAPGGEFAFVLLGEAAAKNIVAASLCSQAYLVVALGMALTPLLAQMGDRLGQAFETRDVFKLQPTEGEVDDLRGHVIVAGFGRVGQMICQLLSERLIPFVALDVQGDRVAKGREMEMPVYFGDCGSAAVLKSVGAAKASCAVVVLDTPGSNYRCVYTMKRNFPAVKTYVRARDIAHGLNLEKAGASAVVPETLEPSLQLAAAVLEQMQLPSDEIATAIDSYRRKHVAELAELASYNGFDNNGTGREKAQEKAEAAS